MRITKEDFLNIEKIIDLYQKKIDLNFTISKPEYERRYKEVWKLLEEHDVDFAFYYWYREHPADGVYLTGYNPTLERASGIISPNKRPMLLVGPESGILAEETGLNLPTAFVDEFAFPGEYYEGVELKEMLSEVKTYVGHDIKKIACLTQHDYIPCEYYEKFTYGMNPDAEVVNLSEEYRNIRFNKSDEEFLALEYADIIASAATRAMLAVSRPGLRELQIAAVGDYVAKALGAESYGCETIVTSADRCRTVIGPATNRVIQEGDIVQISSSPSFQCYKGMCRRAFVMGTPSQLQEEFFEILVEGYEIAKNTLARICETGESNALVDLEPRTYFGTKELDGENMADYHFFSDSHGVGLSECLEPMLVHPYIEQYYVENCGMRIDLGLYLHPNTEICGASIESSFEKKGRKLRCTTDLPANVQSLVGKDI
ncbi:MAG TPA: M24 family metallopeptidase [Clostridiaceae bacterium]|nr:M24 family metallopeptidase [Clostridiaceae bacterium]